MGDLSRLRAPDFQRFWRDHRLCTVTTLRADSTPHVVPMGVVLDFDGALAWAVTRRGSVKVANIVRAGETGAAIAVCQVEGGKWSTIEGRARVHGDPAVVREAERRYAERYRTPSPNPERVAVRIGIERILGNV